MTAPDAFTGTAMTDGAGTDRADTTCRKQITGARTVIGMTDQGRVISLLSEIAEYFGGCRENASFGSKAEEHFWELKNAATEAAELLKAQEPRLLGLDEVRNLINIPRWAEYYVSVGSGEPAIQAGWALVQYEGADEEHFVDFATAYGLERWHVAVYGNRWRMWTSRPTDEQREATPWEPPKEG